MDYSVVVVGGGPAGALAAWRLARSGARVLVIDRERPARVEAAEILSPEGHGILVREQLWHEIPLNLTLPCSAMASAWEGPAPVWTSFARQPQGCAWHIDRIRFDAWLLGRIQTASVIVRRGTVQSLRRNSEGWTVDFTADGTSESTSARCLIIATGRAANPLRLARRRRSDNLCLVAGTTTADPIDTDALIVEATDDGWWYSAPLLSGRLFTGWMTDFSLVKGNYARAAMASLARAPLHASRVGTARLSTFIGSATWTMEPAAGAGWIAIGDAALARDPISGDGLSSALLSASHGADVVARALGGDESAWTTAADDANDVASRYQARRLDLYRAAAGRWPASPFWRRFAE